MKYTKTNFPTDWDNVPLRIGKNLFTIETSGMTDHQYLEKVVECFDIDIKNLNIEDLNILKMKAVELISSKPKETIETEYIIGGVRYHLVTDFKKLTFGEFLDLELLLSDDTVNLWSIMGNVLSILLREVEKEEPKILGKVKFKYKPYNSEDTLEKGKYLEDVLSVNDVYSINTFFLLKGLIYSQTLISSLTKTQAMNPQN